MRNARKFAMRKMDVRLPPKVYASSSPSSLDTGLWITDEKGRRIKVTDLAAALSQAEHMNLLGEQELAYKAQHPNHKIMEGPIRHWRHILNELNKLKA